VTAPRGAAPPGGTGTAPAPPRLILVEGLPGAGKSTLAHRIARHLARLGRPVRWWYEEERGHPLHAFDDRESLGRVVDDLFSGHHARFVAAVLDRWRGLASTLAGGDGTVVMDGMLLGHLTWSLFPADVPPAEIEGYVRTAAGHLRGLRPALLYLRQPDVGAAVRRTCRRRGGATEAAWTRRATQNPYARRRGLEGFAGMVAFWSAYGALADALFEEVDLPKLAVEVGPGAWAGASAGALRFLGLPPARDPAPPPEQLARYTGAYIRTDGDRPARCEVALRRGALSLDGAPGVWPRTRLIADGPSVPPAAFALESLPFRAEFDAIAAAPGGETGLRMRLSGPELLRGRVDATYLRAPKG
jgi:thymidylate kinase